MAVVSKAKRKYRTVKLKDGKTVSVAVVKIKRDEKNPKKGTGK
jgi:hypothetical protein